MTSPYCLARAPFGGGRRPAVSESRNPRTMTLRRLLSHMLLRLRAWRRSAAARRPAVCESPERPGQIPCYYAE